MYITRPSLRVGRYKMIKHKLDKGNDINPKRFNMLAKTRQTWKLDGMNTVEYEIVSRDYLPLFTNITVNIGTETGLHAAPPPPPKPDTQAKVEDKSHKTAANPPAEALANVPVQVPADPLAKVKEDHPQS